MKLRLRIGTRGSRLARWQAELVRARLQAAHADLVCELVVVRTQGDRDRATPLARMAQVGVFTKELERALDDDLCDLAVHSLKDVPTELAPRFALAAVLEREDPRDALVAPRHGSLRGLPEGARVGSSSLRRRAQLAHLRPDLELCDLRGNVPTRLRAVGVDIEDGRDASGQPLDATVLALAGLKRLGLDGHASQILEPDIFLPAPAQGAVAVEVRSDDSRVRRLVAALDNAPTRRCVTAERAFMRTLEGGCKVPVAALAEMRGGRVELDGLVASYGGETVLRDRCEGDDPEEVGRELAERLLGAGAKAVLDEVRRLSSTP